MNAATLTAAGPELRPAQRVDNSGRLRIDNRAVFSLALPLMLAGGIQVVLTLTDAWFIGHISTSALASVAAVQGLISIVIFVLGCPALIIQSLVAQACGARRYKRAALATWTALWATLLVTPLFLAAARGGHIVLAVFGLDSSIERLAFDFWFPRVSGGSLSAALLVMCGFFTGVGRPRITALVSAATVVANIAFNELFIINLSFGVSGSAWATNGAQACGLLFGFSVFLSDGYHRTYGSRVTYRPRTGRVQALLWLGLPTGLLVAADVLGYSLFQLMQVRLSAVEGAATQLVTMLTTISSVPGYGIASAGTTFVGHSVGSRDPDWAMRVGTRVITLTALCMGGIGLLLAIVGPWIISLFLNPHAEHTTEIRSLGGCLLWIAAAYQVFDAFNLGSASCLRGAGDVTAPAALVLPVSLLIFVPLAHSFTFAPGQGWVHFLPQFGWGAIGGWISVLIYIALLGVSLFLRWRSRAWQRIAIRI